MNRMFIYLIGGGFISIKCILFVTESSDQGGNVNK